MKQLIIYRAAIGVLLGALVLVGAWKEAKDFVQGEVTRIDSASGMLTLSDGKHLAIDAGTLVRKDGIIASLSDIKEGDQVQASFLPSIASLLGRKDALLDRVTEVVATSQGGTAGAM
jgi:hypothetical protein